MSNLTAALAAFLQNHDTIGPLISGIISDRNFDNQEHWLTVEPRTCLVVSDMLSHETGYIGTAQSGDVKEVVQLELRIITRVSDAYLDGLKKTSMGILWVTTKLPWDNSYIPFNMTSAMPYPDIDQVTKTWFNIITIDYEN